MARNTNSKYKKNVPRGKHKTIAVNKFVNDKKARMLVAILLFASVGAYMLITTLAGPSGPTVSADNFERNRLGANWSVPFGPVSIVNNSDLGLRSASPLGIASWTGSALGADHYSEGQISSDRVSNMLTQVFARRRSSDAARYGFHYANDPGKTPEWQIKYDGVPTAQTRILATNRTVPAPRPGDRLRIEVRGSNPVEIRGYHNGVLILTASDTTSSRILNGLPGLAHRLQVNTTTTYPTAVWESWAGGTLLSTKTAPTNGHSSTPTDTPPTSTPPTGDGHNTTPTPTGH